VGEVGDEVAFDVEHLRADGDVEQRVVPVGAVLSGAAARLPATGRVLPPGAELRQVAEIRIRDENDIASPAAVTAVGPPARDVLLAPEAQRTVSPTPGDRGDAGAVVEHDGL